MVINSLEKLIKAIDSDLYYKKEKKIRFINIERLDVWVKVKDLITSRCVNQLLLSKLCSQEDLTPNTSRLMSKLKKINYSTVVLPLSEHLRINNDNADQLLSDIFSLDYMSNKSEGDCRIYFPMYRMKSALKNKVQMDPRLKETVWFFEPDELDDEYTLTILPRSYTTKIRGNNIEGYRNYLSYWEDNPCKPIILQTDNAIYYKDNVYADNVVVLTSAFDILQYYKFLEPSVLEGFGEENLWNKLLRDIGVNPTLTSYFKNYFSIAVFKCDELIMQWHKYKDDYSKWLIWLWLKIENCTPYLNYCVQKSNKWTDFIVILTNSIFEFPLSSENYWNMYDERKKFLKKLLIEHLPSSYWDIFFSHKGNKRSYFLTDTVFGK